MVASSATIVVSDPNQLQTNMTDLIVWEVYHMQVCAFNSKGDGLYSEPMLRVRTKEGLSIRFVSSLGLFVRSGVGSLYIRRKKYAHRKHLIAKGEA